MRALTAGSVLGVLIGAPLWADSKPTPDRKFVFVDVLFIGNLARSMNALAQQGYRLKLVTHRDQRAVGVMERTAPAGTTFQYRVVESVDTKRLNIAAQGGFRVVPRTLQFEPSNTKFAGTMIDLIVLENDPRETAQYEYEVLSAGLRNSRHRSPAPSRQDGIWWMFRIG